MILDSVADLYENLEMIMEQVNKWAADEYGLAVSRDEVLGGLSRLIEAGLVRAYHLTSREVRKIDGMPDADALSECYFLITGQGKLTLAA